MKSNRGLFGTNLLHTGFFVQLESKTGNIRVLWMIKVKFKNTDFDFLIIIHSNNILRFVVYLPSSYFTFCFESMLD